MVGDHHPGSKTYIMIQTGLSFRIGLERVHPRRSGKLILRPTYSNLFKVVNIKNNNNNADESVQVGRKKHLRQGFNKSSYQSGVSMRSTVDSLDVHFYLNKGLGSIVLLAATGLALCFANMVTTASIYESFWHSRAGPQNLNLSMSLHHWVNEGLMALFFFTVGLEIKREFIHGSLSSMKQAILPCIGALGGMFVPMLFYLAFNLTSPEGVVAGWAIPMATDIAFAMGVYGFFKNKMPNGVAAFLLTLATVDDLGAILVIAIFFSKTLIKEYILAAIILSGIMFSACKMKITNIKLYMSLFVLLWYCLLQGGINADIAGVITALSIPGCAMAPLDTKAPPEHDSQKVTLLDHLIYAWSPWTTLLVMPLFALANTAVLIDRAVVGSIFNSAVGQGIFFGLALGKPIGIAGISWIAVRSGLAKFPKGMGLKHLSVVGLLGGIGFTMSLFLIEMALSGNYGAIRTAKMAILSSSFASAVLGCILMHSFPEYEAKKN